MKKYIIIITVIAFSITGCNSESDYFSIDTGEFEVTFLNEKGDTITNFADSVKVNVETFRSVTVVLNGQISEYYVTIDEKYEGSLGDVLINDNYVEKGEETYVKGGSFRIAVMADQAKVYEGYLKIGDRVDEQIFSFRVVAFDNMLPVAQLKINTVALNSPYEIEISAIESYDQDEKYGGEIVEWEYMVGSYYKYNTTEYSSIYHILPTTGTYTISLRVKDNDGVWSNTVYESVSL